jgi:hypothetical protein
MWIESFRQFLNRSLQRIGDWARGLDFLPGRLRREVAPQDGGEAYPAMDPSPDDQQMDLSYHFRSLRCHVQVSIMEPTPGMKYIYQALREAYKV